MSKSHITYEIPNESSDSSELTEYTRFRFEYLPSNICFRSDPLVDVAYWRSQSGTTYLRVVQTKITRAKDSVKTDTMYSGRVRQGHTLVPWSVRSEHQTLEVIDALHHLGHLTKTHSEYLRAIIKRRHLEDELKREQDEFLKRLGLFGISLNQKQQKSFDQHFATRKSSAA